MNPEFKSYIHELVKLDKEEEEYKIKIKKVKEEREMIENVLIDYIEKNNYQDKNFVYQNKNIKYSTVKTQDSITKKLILERLELFLENKKKAEDAVFFIYTDRDVKKKTVLKINNIKT